MSAAELVVIFFGLCCVGVAGAAAGQLLVSFFNGNADADGEDLL